MVQTFTGLIVENKTKNFTAISWRFLFQELGALKPHMVYIYTYLKEFFDVIVVDLENEFLRPEDEKELEEFKKNL